MTDNYFFGFAGPPGQVPANRQILTTIAAPPAASSSTGANQSAGV